MEWNSTRVSVRTATTRRGRAGKGEKAYGLGGVRKCLTAQFRINDVPSGRLASATR